MEQLLGSFHSAVVHIPIGLLLIYGLIEIAPVRAFHNDVRWQMVKRVLLFVGLLGALVALQTGDAAGEGRRRAIVSAHEFFAQMTVWFFGVLALIQIILIADIFVSVKLATRTAWLNMWSVLRRLAQKLSVRWVTFVLALFGTISLFITGALGGGIAHGVEVDPVVSLVVRMLGLE